MIKRAHIAKDIRCANLSHLPCQLIFLASGVLYWSTKRENDHSIYNILQTIHWTSIENMSEKQSTDFSATAMSGELRYKLDYWLTKKKKFISIWNGKKGMYKIMCNVDLIL